MSPQSKLTRVKYVGDVPCYTTTPPADWQPQEEKELDSDGLAILSNELFKVVNAPSAPAPPSQE